MTEAREITARVISQHRGGYVLHTDAGELAGTLAGRLRHETVHADDLPAVGDNVLARSESPGTCIIHAVLPRRSAVRRGDTGIHDAQILAANVDDVFIVVPLHRDIAPIQMRIQQYVALARDSGAEPLILLTKADLCPDVRAQVTRASRAAPGVPVLVTSSVTGDGVGDVAERLAPGRTAVLLGPSGAGKSTLINALAATAMLATREVDEFGEGRHASVRRELIHLPGGGAVIDTPGLREVFAWVSEEVIDAAFADVAALADRCRFRDCAHEQEPGCAVREAVASGALDPLRLAGMRKLERESARMRKSAVELRRASRALGRQHRDPEKKGYRPARGTTDDPDS
ncbi:MAG TPA: ribosome small subunit-dependent GTPase A [Candidatus Limnocylindria bacterium]|nr:ribosome small subunit-dependent GTPase A [Candidatus Limnocylindria bacterium]